MNKKKCLLALIISLNLAIWNNALAQTTCENGIDPPCDEQASFTSVAPDALLLLDFSGSMAQNPAGGDNIYGAGGCAGPFYSNSGTGHTVNCSKQAILKRAILSILDYNANNTVDINDSNGLNVRMGYMRFLNCSDDDTGGDYASGCNKLIRGLGSAYSQIYCGSTTSCASTVTSCSGSGECIVGTSATGGTPLASALKEAKAYLDYNKSQDTAKACRQKFVIVVTDGSDTYACNGNGSDCQGDMYKLRRETVAATKQLADAGYKVFVIGFGSTMPLYLQNTLNWMAYYGGTDNPLVANSGATTGYNLPLGCTATPAVSTACCNLATNATACYPTGVTSCFTETAGNTITTSDCGTSTNRFEAKYNDPGYINLSGYAFLATDTASMKQALASAINTIAESVYTFSQASVQAVRTQDENFLYEASFRPVNNDPFWIGHLKKYNINADGTIASSALWDAGSQLVNNSSRNIFTFKGGAKTAFNTTNILPADVIAAGSTDTATRDMIVNFILNGETSPDVTNWKLGDIFHSFPVTIGTPSLYYFDSVDQSQYTCPNQANSAQTCKAFDLFRAAHTRDSSNGKRIMVIGADDGQLHAFQTTTGNEVWSLIPPNFLSELQLIAHPAHPTAYGTSALGHQYFMDGYTSYSEVWMGTGTGKNKSPSEWNTLMVAAEGRGGNSTLWSQSANCDSSFYSLYANTTHTPVYYPNYCGYYAFDVTADTFNPVFKWRIGSHTALSSDDAKHLAQPWSKMIMGRVNINGNEKWVGMIGGGYSGNNCTGTTCDTRGKGFYVIDLMTGDVLWSYTHNKSNSAMAYDLVANPALVDFDDDGFVDTVYIGDLGGNVWRFTFCLKTDVSCGTSNWAGGKFFDAQGTGGQIFHMNSVATDPNGNLLVYFGTGNETDPTFAPTNGTTDKFFALIDKNRTSTTPITLANLKNITSGTFNYTTDTNNYSGWVINLTTPGEKVLGETTVFEGAVMFTTYVPGSASDPCDQSGDANFYLINYLTGAGLFNNNNRSEDIGAGIPSAPIVSIGPSPTSLISIYASTSQSGSSGGGSATKSLTLPNNWQQQPCLVSPCPTIPPKGWLWYWHDLRLQ
ncbi:MAG: PilC/PilY family type IV pilus protein [Smithellaceae bacterium]|jgi:Tfp pilus tip-associated adhesin PilY1